MKWHLGLTWQHTGYFLHQIKWWLRADTQWEDAIRYVIHNSYRIILGNMHNPVWTFSARFVKVHTVHRVRRYLNKTRVGSHEHVGETIRRVDSVKEGIDVVVLNKITAPCTQKMDSTREYGIGLFFSYHTHYFVLILLVVVQLLSQWNGTLQNQQNLVILGHYRCARRRSIVQDLMFYI